MYLSQRVEIATASEIGSRVFSPECPDLSAAAEAVMQPLAVSGRGVSESRLPTLCRKGSIFFQVYLQHCDFTELAIADGLSFRLAPFAIIAILSVPAMQQHQWGQRGGRPAPSRQA